MKMLPVRNKTSGRTRVVVVDSNKQVKPWSSQVADAALRALNTQPMWRGPVAVSLTFFFTRPKGHYGTGRNAHTLRDSAPGAIVTKPDIDKLARCVLDALTGVAFHDDAQVTVLNLHKLYGEPERLEARVTGL